MLRQVADLGDLTGAVTRLAGAAGVLGGGTTMGCWHVGQLICVPT
jgi:hypothetical protein